MQGITWARWPADHPEAASAAGRPAVPECPAGPATASREATTTAAAAAAADDDGDIADAADAADAAANADVRPGAAAAPRADAFLARRCAGADAAAGAGAGAEGPKEVSQDFLLSQWARLCEANARPPARAPLPACPSRASGAHAAPSPPVVYSQLRAARGARWRAAPGRLPPGRLAAWRALGPDGAVGAVEATSSVAASGPADCEGSAGPGSVDCASRAAMHALIALHERAAAEAAAAARARARGLRRAAVSAGAAPSQDAGGAAAGAKVSLAQGSSASRSAP
jgi:hypothetical protein